MPGNKAFLPLLCAAEIRSMWLFFKKKPRSRLLIQVNLWEKCSRRVWPCLVFLLCARSFPGCAQQAAMPPAPKPALLLVGAAVDVLPVGDGTLTLAQAEAIAIGNQPALLAAQLRAREGLAQVRERQSARLPVVNFNATGALVADTDTTTAAGALTTSSLSDRFAYGGTLVQLVTDFGRTSALIDSQKAAAEARSDRATLTRAQIRLRVQQAYYGVLGAEAVLHAAQQAQANRSLISRQVNALAQSQLRSTLDVNFAGVLESQAELAVVRAHSTVEQARVQLGTALGTAQPITAALALEALPQPLPATPAELLTEAAGQRADLGAARADQQSAQRYASAEKRLSYPTLNVLAAGGEIPFRDHTLQDNYAAAGFNLQIPVFNGGLYRAEREQAELEAGARARDVQSQSLEVSEQVRDAWYAAEEAFQSIPVSVKLVAQSREALRLAQARYDAGLGSIVELNEAQLNETSAEITAADTTYTYLTRRATLDYATGHLN